jgi:hypothetical protein
MLAARPAGGKDKQILPASLLMHFEASFLAVYGIL